MKSRGTAWARGVAKAVAGVGLTPDAVSAASVILAGAGGVLLFASSMWPTGPRAAGLVIAAVLIQLRLLCNLIDGMVAVEHGQGSPLGPLWNEVPDRLADAFFLLGAGYAVAACGLAGGEILGWLASLLAVFTAYVRELGRGLGLPADFSGPMAKPQRMAALTLACLVSALEPAWGWHGHTLLAALALIAAGSALTSGRRLAHHAARLRAQGDMTP